MAAQGGNSSRGSDGNARKQQQKGGRCGGVVGGQGCCCDGGGARGKDKMMFAMEGRLRGREAIRERERSYQQLLITVKRRRGEEGSNSVAIDKRKEKGPY